MLVALVATIAVAIASSSRAEDLEVAAQKPALHRGLTAQNWYQRYIREHRALTRHGKMVRSLRADVRHTHNALVRLAKAPRFASASYAIRLASSASGLFQFLDSTWARHGIAGFSVFDPVANALAAARLVADEGWSQWVCKP